jgi:exopolyphosphatase / guanosine-5'-triphosphate,3'-diphosphate pyrophosphatase
MMALRAPVPGTDPAVRGPVAVIDVGSNSIRLVVFSGLNRSATTMFNEKVLCGLGRGLASSGRLHPQGVAMARQNLLRFTRLATAMGACRIDMLATAAVREATDGSAFVAEIEDLCGQTVQVLDGAEEARLSALGLLSGFPAARGVMGDLGGGSLELVELADGNPGRSTTLRLGPFSLMERFANDSSAMRSEIDAQLSAAGWVADGGSLAPVETFYPIGGAWRSLARIHMQQSNYPLHVVHGYPMRPTEVDDLSRVISRLGRRSLARIEGITKSRLETLPVAAEVLRRVLRALRCRNVVFSALGLREGHHFDLLSAAERARDPLLEVATDIAIRTARFDMMGEDLQTWTDCLFIGESAAEKRLRLAACLLSDVAWREHPDYRPSQALMQILHYPISGIGHSERAFLATTVHTRYGGSAEGGDVSPYLALLEPESARRARILGLALRLAYRVSGATGTVLRRSALAYDVAASTLHLQLPDDGSAPGGEAVLRRFNALAQALGVDRALMEG